MRLLRKARKDHGLLGQGVLMKKLVSLLIVMCICLAGCSLRKEYDLHGKDRIEAFRAEAAQWQSGRYLVTDLETGITTQAFSFKYEADGSQSYLYEQVSGTDYYYEYNSGGVMEVYDGENVTVLTEGSEGYVSYDKEDPHPYSTGDLLFYVNLFVKSSLESSDNGNTIYMYNYDTDKLNETQGTSFTEFSTKYAFDGQGNFLYFEMSNAAAGENYSYRIEVLDVNGIDEIERPSSQ